MENHKDIPWDILPTEREKEFIKTIEKESENKAKCPFLKKLENLAHYCDANPEGSLLPSYRHTKLSCAELQLWCYDRFENCIYYKECQRPSA